jgi:hypothetical protein
MTVVNAGEVQRFIRALRKVLRQVEELVEGGVTGPRLAIRIGLANALAEQLYRANHTAERFAAANADKAAPGPESAAALVATLRRTADGKGGNG